MASTTMELKMGESIPKCKSFSVKSSKYSKGVSFSPYPDITYIEKRSHKISKRSTLKMSKKVIQIFGMEQMNDPILQEAALLFSNNYGIWGERAKEVVGPFAKQGLLR
jgi:hypothetical protein